MIADGQLVVAGGDGPVLLEPSDGPLDHVALAVAHRIHDRRPATPGASPGPSLLLVGTLGDGVGDPPLTEQPSASGVTVAAISNQVRGALARPPPPWPRNPDSVQQRPKLGALMTLTGGYQHGQRPPAPIGGQVDLGGQPAVAASQCLVKLGRAS